MKFYVYELVVIPDAVVCYVGKGSGRRMYNHRKYVTSKPAITQSYLYRKLSELIAAGKSFEPRKVFETDDEQAALIEERRRIEEYGLDNLFNCGLYRGTLCEQINEAQRVAMSKARRGYVAKLQSEHGCKMLPEHAAKIGAAHKGTKHSSGPAISAALKGRKVTWGAKVSATMKGRVLPAETAQKISAALTGRRKSPENVAASVAGSRASTKRSARYKSRYRGVGWFEPKKAWQSRIMHNGKSNLLGQFKLEIDAAWAYDNAFERSFCRRPNGTDPEHIVTRFKRRKHGVLAPKIN